MKLMSVPRWPSGVGHRPARLLVATALVGLTLTGCSKADPGVAAYVGDDEVTQTQVDQAVKGLASIVEAGQTVSVEAVVNALIQGELAEQIAAEQKIPLTDAARTAVLKGTNLADLVNVADAQPVVYDVADQAIVAQKLGNAAYLDQVKTRSVTLNPRYGVLDPTQKTIVSDQSGSLSVPAPNPPVAAP
ncbi:hypothetical protein [uncultured Friedmanniella sp.]|uniref:hypothetical protein n=1 Tax=uncultured Friedmanniella sp. TaxID=335381 RepID=UPI0035CAE527